MNESTNWDHNKQTWESYEERYNIIHNHFAVYYGMEYDLDPTWRKKDE